MSRIIGKRTLRFNYSNNITSTSWTDRDESRIQNRAEHLRREAADLCVSGGIRYGKRYDRYIRLIDRAENNMISQIDDSRKCIEIMIANEEKMKQIMAKKGWQKLLCSCATAEELEKLLNSL